MFGKRELDYTREEAQAAAMIMQARYEQFDSHTTDGLMLAGSGQGDRELLRGLFGAFMLTHPALAGFLADEGKRSPSLISDLGDLMVRMYVLGYIARVQVEAGLRAIPKKT